MACLLSVKDVTGLRLHPESNKVEAKGKELEIESAFKTISSDSFYRQE